MARVLHIKATPRDEESRTMWLAEGFLEAYSDANPDDEIETLDLFKADIAEFDALAAAAKYRVLSGEQHSGEEAERWQRVVETAEHFKSFDKYVISTPMWNFSIPYKLKLYIDTIVQPGLTFSYDPESGFAGLVGDKPVQVLSTRGGDYSPESGSSELDFQMPYLKHILGFMGLTKVEFLIAQPLDLAPPEESKKTLASAIERAREAGRDF